MPPKKKPIDPDLVETIWAAGVISSGGSLKVVRAGNTRVVRFVLTSGRLPGSIHRLAQYMGSSVTELPSGSRVSAQGASLHALMTRTWDYLTMERKLEYRDSRKEITSTLEGPNPYRDDKEIEE